MPFVIIAIIVLILGILEEKSDTEQIDKCEKMGGFAVDGTFTIDCRFPPLIEKDQS